MKRIVRTILVLTVASLAVYALQFKSLNAQTMILETGSPAPEFEALNAEGELWRSADHVGKKILVVYFYPGAMTGGCTDQACNFRDDRTKLTEMGAEVVGISGDPVSNLELFKRVNNLNFPLLSDEQGTIARAFGVPVRGGGTITRVVDGEEKVLTREISTARWTFIIGLDGTIKYKDTEVNAAGDSKTVIEAIENMVGN